jgi:hypothetical protein
MIEREPDQIYLRKVVFTFLAGGLAGAVCFGWFVTREGLRSVWFVRQGIFVSPTLRFWVFTSLVFFISQAASWGFSYVNGWLSLHLESYTRLFLALVLLADLPILLHSPVLAMPVLGSFLIGPILLASFLSLTLFGITGRWQGKAAKGIILASFMITPLASFADAIIGSPMRIDGFEAVRFLIGSCLLSTLSGYWAAKSAGVAKCEAESLTSTTSSID